MVAFCPYSHLQDNPNLKVIFSTRHPVDRLYSTFQFAQTSFRDIFDRNFTGGMHGGEEGPSDNFDDFMETGTQRDDKFGYLRDMIMNGTSEEEMIKMFFSHYEKGARRGVMFAHSMSYFPVLNFVRELGLENVMVVNSEDLQVPNLASLAVMVVTLQYLKQFILCAWLCLSLNT